MAKRGGVPYHPPMASVTCPDCGTTSEGAYCPRCGARLQNDPCPGCGQQPPPGARFCTSCGERLERRPRSLLPWALAAVSVAALVAVLLVTRGDGEAPNRVIVSGASDGDGTTTAPFTGGSAGGSPPPLTGTPREQADRLFNRVMTHLAEGDSAQALRFAPMAVQAYGMAAPLDPDGLYHLSLLQTVAGDPAAARATAEQVLTEHPAHLLALAAAAEAARASGDPTAARGYARRFLASFEAERASALPEYEMHASILPEYRDKAEQLIEPK